MSPLPASTRTPVRRSLRLTAAVCACAVWLLGLFAVSPQLHGHLHHGDSDHAETSAEHVCAVTLFQHGVENPMPDAALRLAARVQFLGTLAVAPLAAPATVDVRLQPGRGPPRR